MEIYTTNLFNVNVEETKLQNNFVVIDKILKGFQMQLSQFSVQQQLIIKSIEYDKNQIEASDREIIRQNNELKKHKNWIQQLNEQFSSFDVMKSDTVIPSQKLDVFQRKQSIREYKEEKIEPILYDISKYSEIAKSIEVPKQKQQKKRPDKNNFEKTISSIKERLEILEKDNKQKEEKYEQITKYLHIKKKKPESSKQKANKESKTVEMQQTQNQSEKVIQNNNEDKGSEQKKDAQKQVTEDNKNMNDDDVFEQEQMDLQNKVNKIVMEISKIWQSLSEKTRVLDRHFKEDQQKIYNLEKNMDLLQRSHDILKYDYQRTTSTGWSKARKIDPLDKKQRRRESKLNDTRISNKDFYEDKLIQLFNQIDFLKGQYFQIQSKLQKDEQNLTQSQKIERKGQFANKLNLSLQENGDNIRKQIIMYKRQAKKLRQEFEQFAYGENSGKRDVKTVYIRPNQNKQDWKDLSTKMYKLKVEVQSGIKDLEGKIVTNNDMSVVLNELEVGIQQCKLLLRKKVETADFQKTIKRIEGRLNNFIIQIFEKEGKENQLDASMAKQPWFCLSCDNQLKSYTGKVQKTSKPTQKLMGRKVNPQSHMIRRNQTSNGRLPSVIK